MSGTGGSRDDCQVNSEASCKATVTVMNLHDLLECYVV